MSKSLKIPLKRNESAFINTFRDEKETISIIESLNHKMCDTCKPIVDEHTKPIVESLKQSFASNA